MDVKEKVAALRRDAFLHLNAAGHLATDREQAWKEIERYLELMDEAEDLRTGRKKDE